MAYGLGQNIWGQLGFDPMKINYLIKLEPIAIKSLDDDPNVRDYTITQIECG